MTKQHEKFIKELYKNEGDCYVTLKDTCEKECLMVLECKRICLTNDNAVKRYIEKHYSDVVGK